MFSDRVLLRSFVNDFLSLFLSSSHNNFTGIVDLPEGEHQYKFYVDGHWTLDPKKVNTVQKCQKDKKSLNKHVIFNKMFFFPRKNHSS